MKKIIFHILLICLPLSLHAQGLPYREVSQKLQQDKVAFAQFQYLGTLNCLDKQFGVFKNDYGVEVSKFSQGYGSLFNHMNALPRLFGSGSLKSAFVKFEQQHYSDYRQTSWNTINECSKVYSSNAARQLFVQFVSNPKNYILHDEDDGYDEQDLHDLMADYLRLGRIDVCRYIDSERCPVK